MQAWQLPPLTPSSHVDSRLAAAGDPAGARDCSAQAALRSGEWRRALVRGGVMWWGGCGELREGRVRVLQCVSTSSRL
jgi:hypothetical protein